MSKLNKDYQKKGFRGFVNWVNADLSEEGLKEELHEASAPRAEVHPSHREAFQHYMDHNGKKIYRVMYRILAAFVCVTVIAVLLTVVNVLPAFGDPSNPTNNEVYVRYMEQGMEEAGAVNAVCSVILNYRGFDTLNEAHVLFIATCAVMILLRIDHKKGVTVDREYEQTEYDRSLEPHNDLILQKTAKILVPFIFIFGFNIMLNGHLSPGGGFSGGAIAGGGMILFLVAFGFKKAQKFFNDHVYHIVKTTALFLYTVIMTYFIYTGANQIANGISLGTPGDIVSAGIMLPINIIVGLEVTCTMYGLYSFFRKGGL